MYKPRKQPNPPESEKLLKAQAYQIGTEGWLQLYCTLAQFPFSTTEELWVLSGLAPTLSLNRLQIYLRRAVDWGWVDFVTRYHGPPGISELTPLAGGGLACLFNKPALLLKNENEQNYFESLLVRPAATSNNLTRQARHFYITSKGARILTQMIKLAGWDRVQQLDYQELQSWQSEQVKLYGFEKKEILPCLQRLEGLSLTRQFLIKMAKASFTGEGSPFELWWQDGGLLFEKFLCIKGRVGLDLPNFFDSLMVINNQLWFFVVDTERLAPAWLMAYLTKLYFEFENKEGLDQLFTLLCSIPWQSYYGPYQKATWTLEKLANRKTVNIPEVSRNSMNSKVKVIVLCHTGTRAFLWQEAINRTEIFNRRENQILSFEIASSEEMDQKARAVTGSSLGQRERAQVKVAGSSGVRSNNLPLSLKGVSRSMKNYLAQHLTSMPEVQVGIMNTRAAFSKEMLLQDGFVGKSESEPWVMLEILKLPARRKLLFTLHSYAMLDLPAWSRLTGIEMTHLARHVEQLRQKKLVGQLWGGDACKMRKWRDAQTESGYETKAPASSNSVSKFSFISSSDIEQDLNLDIQKSEAQNRRQRYQNYGQLGQTRDAARFPFAPEEQRINRYHYFLTRRGLNVLLWLEGFQILFEPRYRGELKRIDRISEEVTAGERKLMTLNTKFKRSPVYTDKNWEGSFQINTNTYSLIEIPPDEKVKTWAGYSWPSLLTEHASGVVATFLSFPSRHLSLPFQTAPAIYPVSSSKLKTKSRIDESAIPLFDNPGSSRQHLFPESNRVCLETWQTEPLCHRYYLQPQMLVLHNYASPYSYLPSLKTLKQEAGGETGQCLPDGYGEVMLEKPEGTKRWVTIYLEYERGQRNWLQRYKAKINSYLHLFWSEWLLHSISVRQPLVTHFNAPRYLLFVTSDPDQESKLIQLAKTVISETLWGLLEEANYQGYGPMNYHKKMKLEQLEGTQNLLAGLGLQIFFTHEDLLNNFGILSPIWKKLISLGFSSANERK